MKWSENEEEITMTVYFISKHTRYQVHFTLQFVACCLFEIHFPLDFLAKKQVLLNSLSSTNQNWIVTAKQEN